MNFTGHIKTTLATAVLVACVAAPNQLFGQSTLQNFPSSVTFTDAAFTDASPQLPTEPAFSPDRIKELMRPTLTFISDWQPQRDSNDVGIYSASGRISFPTYPIFGPPPPIISPGFRYTNLDAPARFRLPSDLYEYQLQLAWMRRINDRWMLRFMAGTTFATDSENTSSDAWRFTGGAFAMYRRNSVWTWTFGAIALGRNDLPVLPAVGVIYQPTDHLRFDLIMPRPKISCLLKDNGDRQQWAYLGASLNGATWGVAREIADANSDANDIDDQLSYGDVRFALGWESTPRQEPGIPFTRGRKIGVEIGYAFSRDFEFESDDSNISLADTLSVRGTISF